MNRQGAATATSRGLLTRDRFRERVFARDGGRCVMCPAPAVDPHHILERRLFPDGGYYLDNGASVCGACHLRCETTDISVEEIRAAAGIAVPVLPPGFLPDLAFDKWGNVVHADGTRSFGPLENDEGMLKALGSRRFTLFHGHLRRQV